MKVKQMKIFRLILTKDISLYSTYFSIEIKKPTYYFCLVDDIDNIENLIPFSYSMINNLIDNEELKSILSKKIKEIESNYVINELHPYRFFDLMISENELMYLKLIS